MSVRRNRIRQVTKLREQLFLKFILIYFTARHTYMEQRHKVKIKTVNHY